MDEFAKAREKALVYLTDMDRTEQELRKKLLRAGFSLEAVDDALDYVRGYGYVDDEKYVRRYLDSGRKKHSLRRIRCDLAQKGIPESGIDTAIGELDSTDERPLIRQLAEKKLRTIRGKAENAEIYRKLAAFLNRKGFNSADIHSVLSEMDFGEEQMPETEE